MMYELLIEVDRNASDHTNSQFNHSLCLKGRKRSQNLSGTI